MGALSLIITLSVANEIISKEKKTGFHVDRKNTYGPHAYIINIKRYRVNRLLTLRDIKNSVLDSCRNIVSQPRPHGHMSLRVFFRRDIWPRGRG